MAADETTPLIRPANGRASSAGSGGSGSGPIAPRDSSGKSRWRRRVRSWAALGVENRILLAGFLVTLSFSFTQVPLFYVFHLMECEVFYSHNPPFVGPGDRCARNEIAAGTARQYSILGMSTTFCGTFNLFVAGWMVKRFGPRAALLVQTLVPAVRVATQILGVVAGGEAGIGIIQLTQGITVFGGPAGYILLVNVIAGEVVAPARRTSVFGKLQGCIMLGQAIGYLTGGMIGDAWGIIRPFQIAFVFFLISGLYVRIAMPYISAESMNDPKKPAKGGVSGFLAPLRVLAPQVLRLKSGVTRKHYGVLFLCSGVFLGVLATGFVPLLVQMEATASFGFTQADNGWLMSGYAFMRSLFLVFMFPRIISWGRKWFASRGERVDTKDEPEEEESIPTEPQEFGAGVVNQAEGEPVPPEPLHEHENSTFDLFFLRWSLVVDGLLTTGAAFATKGWHIYLAAFLLPFGSGSAPAAKGVITEMCPSSQRADALNAITLVENVARLATQGLFGFIFSALAETGKSYLTFFLNAAVAVIGMAVLLFSHFPPPGSTLVEESEVAESGEDAE
ncbi:MFS general substrate transporter [Coniochaeta ligniaria NRRL 30616]|uniref:MFS general substrate transporter n=1 Tax=Coniochaeta ligniaria NRRL 30616 TaxID=1408157 RepID=A0A1J7IGU3_9PEZI|nr:MFS general substrate transporter [Coniochaeta ligniaria NRRL 30616]